MPDAAIEAPETPRERFDHGFHVEKRRPLRTGRKSLACVEIVEDFGERSALVGMQPQFRQMPPRCSRSTTAVLNRAGAARIRRPRNRRAGHEDDEYPVNRHAAKLPSCRARRHRHAGAPRSKENRDRASPRAASVAHTTIPIDSRFQPLEGRAANFAPSAPSPPCDHRERDAHRLHHRRRIILDNDALPRPTRSTARIVACGGLITAENSRMAGNMPRFDTDRGAALVFLPGLRRLVARDGPQNPSSAGRDPPRATFVSASRDHRGEQAPVDRHRDADIGMPHESAGSGPRPTRHWPRAPSAATEQCQSFDWLDR